MKKKINLTTKGERADIGPYKIMRIVGNRYVDAVGSIVFLDHALPWKHAMDEAPRKANGEGAHPHRGIATLTYVLNGEAVHLDSKGHFARVKSGGVQWMKAGNGIIHDEVVNVDTQANDHLTHVLQFWINLPSQNKAEVPAYVPVKPEEVPVKKLDDTGSMLKVIAGEYENLAAKVPGYLKQFIYHIHLEEGKEFSIETRSDWEYGALLLSNATVNDNDYATGEFILFDRDKGTIELKASGAAADIIVFGGEPYTEPIIAQGPFVMNTQHEISQAYNDFYEGKYGEINYSLAD